MKHSKGLSQEKLIEIKRKSSQLFRAAYYQSKPERCILCNETKDSYCNSHSVPQFSLRTIAENGKLLQSAALINAVSAEDEKGVKNSGVFHIICNSCDKLYFKDYENIDNIIKKPTDKIMGQIAVKNFLLQISKRLAEQNLYQEQFKKIDQSINFESKLEDISLDLKDYFLDFEINKDVVDNNKKNAYHILFWDVLPYQIPIASQGAVTLKKDYKGYPVNNVFDISPDIYMQSLHLLTLPLENQSVVLAFYHKKDKLYSQLRHQLNSIKKDEILKYLNYIIFKEMENYYISTKIEDKIFSNGRLLELAAEQNELPNLGMVNLFNFHNYKPVGIDEIPNLLSEEWSL